MMRSKIKLSFLVCLSLLVSAEGKPLFSQTALIHQRIVSAHAVFLGNAGGADNATNQRAYEAIATALQRINGYTLVDSAGKADLTLELHLDTNETVQHGTSSPDHKIRLDVLDPKTHEVIWTVSERDRRYGFVVYSLDSWSKDFKRNAEKLCADLQ